MCVILCDTCNSYFQTSRRELDITACLWYLNKLSFKQILRELQKLKLFPLFTEQLFFAISSKLRRWEMDLVGCLCLVFPAVEADKTSYKERPQPDQKVFLLLFHGENTP